MAVNGSQPRSGLLRCPTPSKRQEHRQAGRQDGQGTIYFFRESIALGPREVPERPFHFRFRKWQSAAQAWLAGIAAICLAVLLAHARPALAAVPEFSGAHDLSSDAGHVLLTWQSQESVSLRIATAEDFSDGRELYRGRAHSYYLSGLGDGIYLLRLETRGGKVSEPVRLFVTHQSLRRALLLAAVGAIVTLAIALTILKGARDE